MPWPQMEVVKEKNNARFSKREYDPNTWEMTGNIDSRSELFHQSENEHPGARTRTIPFEYSLNQENKIYVKKQDCINGHNQNAIKKQQKLLKVDNIP